MGVEGGVISSSDEMDPVRGRMLGPKSSSSVGSTESLRNSGVDLLSLPLLSRMGLLGLARLECLLADSLVNLLGCGVSCNSSTDIADTSDATLALILLLARLGTGSGRVGTVGDSKAAGSRREKEARPLGVGVRSNRAFATSPLPLPEIIFGCISATDIEDDVEAMLVVLLLLARLGIGSGVVGGGRLGRVGDVGVDPATDGVSLRRRVEGVRLDVPRGVGVLSNRPSTAFVSVEDLRFASAPLPLLARLCNSFLTGSHVLPFFFNASCHSAFLAVQADASCSVACSWNSQRLTRQLGVCSRSFGKMPLVN